MKRQMRHLRYRWETIALGPVVVWRREGWCKPTGLSLGAWCLGTRAREGWLRDVWLVDVGTIRCESEDWEQVGQRG